VATATLKRRKAYSKIAIGICWVFLGIAIVPLVGVVAYVVMNLGLSLFVGDEGTGSVRLLSGHLLLFYLIPLMYFRFVEPRLRDGDGPSHP